MGKPYYDAMDKIRAGEDWKRRTLEKLDAGEIPAAQARPRRRRVRTLVLAAAACALLAGTALALSPGLREALGLFTPYAAPVEGVAAADQGIEVRAVSALSDGNLARVVLEVRDLEGKRLDAQTHIESLDLDRPEAHYGAGGWSYGGNDGFDPETGVLTYVLSFRGDGHPASGGTLEVEIGGFEPGVYRVEEAAFPRGADRRGAGGRDPGHGGDRAHAGADPGGAGGHRLGGAVLPGLRRRRQGARAVPFFRRGRPGAILYGGVCEAYLLL